ncbi:MAG: Lrp/AsnC family transcriptional regulator [Spirochaetia bacterium]|jgi:Lrp/AsnC family transcriptional regulator for asnA, asnC and gidA|nr:Lrp/AsnC family transcriptional regulator [Spirochaetia bacterium]
MADSVKIDSTSLAIIKHLRDGRKPYSIIAEELDITENTVRSRVNKLLSDGILDISGLVNPNALPGHQMILAALKMSTVELGAKAKEFSQLRGVVSVSVVTGRYDLIAYVLLHPADGFSLLDFFSQELSKIELIQDIETFVVYEGIDLVVPYVL